MRTLVQLDYSTKTLVLLFLSILLPLIALSSYLRNEVAQQVLSEKEDKLFGLARQLDTYLEGTFDDILIADGASDADRTTKIKILNAALRDITDFVVSGHPEVGVGYYHRELDAIITYGPSSEFSYHVGQSIEPGHQGLEVMETGYPIVQTGQLVRGNILNCMWPIERDGEVIGYIWANETVDRVQHQIRPIKNRVQAVSFVILIAIYISVIVSTHDLLEAVNHIRDGIDRLVESPSHRIAPVKGSLNGIVTKINDVLARASSLRVHNKHVLDSVANAVVVFDLQGNITTLNKAFYHIIDPTKGITTGQHVTCAFDAPIRDIVGRAMYERESFDNYEIRIGDKILEVSSNEVRDEDDTRIGVLFILRDVTILKRYEQKLKEKERSAALGELSLHVAHEVKNPLTSIKGFTQLLSRDSIPNSKRARYGEVVDSELNRINHLLEELLLYGGRTPLQWGDHDMSVLVREAVNRHAATHPSIRFKLFVEKDADTTAKVDRWKIVQVLDNLISNSIDAVEDRSVPTISVQVKEEFGEPIVIVNDNGSGMDEEQALHVFQPFFTTKPNGFGFGLAVCYRIVESHHGAISIRSRPGHFTSVRVALCHRLKEPAV